MARDFARYNDGSGNPPRLRVQHSLWSLIKLPINAPEWSVAEKMRRVKGAGFEAVECWLDDQNEPEVTKALAESGLRLVLGHRPFTLEDVQATVERAVRLGADFVFAQPADAFTRTDVVVKMVTEGRKAANDAGLPFFVETHRNNYTENLSHMYRLIERMPDIRFTADLSHFILVGEFYGWPEERLTERLGPILERTAHIHARVSNGEQIQVDVGDGDGDTAQMFVELWKTAMQAWLKNAEPGDVFPFTSELGPPRYAITDLKGAEFSDRWEQSLVMKRLGEQAWREAGGR